MLRRLLIQDFVLVDRLELEFRTGFGALTGETGAGKSILLDALSLLLGSRAEGGVVRVGRERADLSAEFELAGDSGALAWLKSQDMEGDEGLLLVRRVIDAGGRSKAYINGLPATATQLRELGEFLADIHGQHAHQALLRPDAQRELLDTFAGLRDVAREVAGSYRDWQDARRARESAEKGMEAVLHERDLLAHQVQELKVLGFDPEEWLNLDQEHARLANSASLLEGTDYALNAVSDGETPLTTEIERVAGRLGELSEYDASLSELAQLVSEAAIRLEEAGHGLRRYRDRVDLDPGRLAEVEQRIEAVVGAARKYRIQPEELPGLLAESIQRLNGLNTQADPAVLQERERLAHEAYRKVAGHLSEVRAKVASQLGDAVTTAMQDLSMAGGCFQIALLPESEGSANGFERVEFQVAANPHQPLRPLAKVASGGELSRIGLSIQVITSESQAVPTLIFDEVDAGIGGRVAEIVGLRLRQLGERRQVLCVTHLPQVAAQADWQWRVQKENGKNGTVSRLVELDRDGRVEEIARMLGGVLITETTRSHAAELLGY